jgi:hypothetical protein
MAPAKLSIAAILLLIAPGCDTGRRERSDHPGCRQNDQQICLIADAIRARMPELTERQPNLPHSEQVRLDVAAILRGMQQSGEHPSTIH